jgi:hypothetical protein
MRVFPFVPSCSAPSPPSCDPVDPPLLSSRHHSQKLLCTHRYRTYLYTLLHSSAERRRRGESRALRYILAQPCTYVIAVLLARVWDSMNYPNGPKCLKEKVDVAKSRRSGSSKMVYSVHGRREAGWVKGWSRIWMS